MISFFPEMTRSFEHPVKTHCRVPVQPVHQFGQFVSLARFQQIVDMIAHNAEGIELKVIFQFALTNCIEKKVAALSATEVKISVITTDSDVIATIIF